MFQFFANIFGYILNIINNFVGNYGLAIILFTVLIKLLMLPLSIKQQKTMKKSAKLQEQMKILQFKYKNDPEKLNREMMDLYKKENMSPFSGCLSAILQFILLISIFYMVRNPLTYMEKIDATQLNVYVQQMKDDGKEVSQAYSEIDIVRELDYLKEKLPEDENLRKINLNMQFLGLDLGKIPQQNLNDWTVYIIPILYIISTFISMRITTSMQTKKKKNEDVIDITEDKENKENSGEERNEMEDAMAQSNKMMSWMMPIMSVSISLVAPLGLALYWLINNVLMIFERLILDKVIKD
ncbi:MAG: YidC/Oxa1 family membrane protein insertase [Clostridia bacterium]|jgi:YidC/Oxa1 family membrane protein insertase|nr:YidC/Oxa1 family membrane protein insertase [Clostridia bacterium]